MNKVSVVRSLAMVVSLSLFLLSCGGGGNKDNVKPELSLSAEPAVLTAPGRSTLRASVSDNVGVIKVDFLKNGLLAVTDTSSPFEYVADFAETAAGTFNFTAVAYDAAGNKSEGSVSVDVKAKSPSENIRVTLLPEEKTLAPDGTVSLQASVSGTTNTEVEWFSTGGTLKSSGLTATFTAPGQEGVFKVTATSKADPNSSASATIRVIKATSNQPPEAVISAAPLSGVAPLTVRFDGSGSRDPDGQITKYEWDFGDGNKSSEKVVDYKYTKPGQYQAKLTCTDDQGLTHSQTVTISVNNQTSTLAELDLQLDGVSADIAANLEFEIYSTAFPDTGTEGGGNVKVIKGPRTLNKLAPGEYWIRPRPYYAGILDSSSDLSRYRWWVSEYPWYKIIISPGVRKIVIIVIKPIIVYYRDIIWVEIKDGTLVCAALGCPSWTFGKAINYSNSTSTIETIMFRSNVDNNVLKVNLPKVSKSVNIVGNGRTATIVNGDHQFSLLDVDNGVTVRISDLTLRNGAGTLLNVLPSVNVNLSNLNMDGGKGRVTCGVKYCFSEGGAINNYGNVSLYNTVISNNTASWGGGIFNGEGGRVILDSLSRVTGNKALGADGQPGVGGGIYSRGTLTGANNATVNNNMPDNIVQ